MTEYKDSPPIVTTKSDFSVYRYQRNIDLPSFGMEGQTSLAEAKVCIVGAGGLGCPVALYLTASGVGNLTLIDNDEVSITNLQRQILYSSDEVGELKVNAGKKKISLIKSENKHYYN